MSDDNSLIDGYQVMSDIASSGTSHVLEVQEPGSGRRLAMKLLNPGHPDFKENKVGLKHEASVAKTLDHPNIIKYEGFTAGRDNTYLLMEYFRAPNVKQQIRLDIAAVHIRLRKLLEGLCAALQHIHDKGWVHRDVKPENVLMNKAGEVRLIDFSLSTKQKSGLSKLFGGKVKEIQGTRTYIAPETIRKQPATPQTDLYSLGITIFEILTGRTPFQAPTPNELLQKHLSAAPPLASELNPNVSPEMDRLVAKLLSKKPDQRGKDMAEISAELRRIKFFKEEPEELQAAKQVEQQPTDALQELKTAKLDSRLDAKRSALLKDNPELAAQYLEDMRRMKAEEAELKRKRAALVAKTSGGAGGSAPAAPVPAPPPVAYPPGYPPQYPPQYAPPYAPPMGAPVMPVPPAMPMPVAYPPAPPMPGMPYPPGMPPAPTMLPPAASYPPPGLPAAQPPAPPPAPAAPPKPAPAPPPQAPAQDLEYMTELPEVL